MNFIKSHAVPFAIKGRPSSSTEMVPVIGMEGMYGVTRPALQYTR